MPASRVGSVDGSGQLPIGGGGGNGNSNHKNHRRSLDEDTVLVTREELDDLFGREYVDELLEREYYDDLD